MAGCAALLIANFPIAAYQDFMTDLFGYDWRMLSGHLVNGTLNILSLAILQTIAFSLAEYHNSVHQDNELNPAISALVSLACIITVTQPYTLITLVNGSAPPGAAIPFFWLGIHGLFLSIVVAFFSTLILLSLHRIHWLRISFYSEESDPIITHAFSGLLPGMLTIMLFALFKTVTVELNIPNLHQSVYDLLSVPFAKTGNTFETAILYTSARQLFWFFGIHGANLIEPITSSIYVPAMEANIEAIANGLEPGIIFTKPFFDVFTAMGGSGSTICLLLAIFIVRPRGSTYKIAFISLLPAIFNINETVMFGLPIVLSPVFLLPFMAVPVLQCIIAYLAMYFHLVPLTITEIGWTTPIFISGHAVTGSYSGVGLQLINLVVGIVIYLPFVRIVALMKRESFNRAFRELLTKYESFDHVLSSEAKTLSRSLISDLSDAIRRNELHLEYQPQVDSLTGKVFGVEALTRWNHHHLGYIPPGLFISLAEESGLIKSMGAWSLEVACRQWDKWRKSGIDDVTMSVNLSVLQLDDNAILDQIALQMRRYDIPKGMLEVEITESAALGGDSKTELLHRIHALGASLAIDDFGMGHSSLVYLKHFPVDTLKIDRVLSRDITTSRHSEEIISTISELCRSLDIHCLVEYVDDIDQLKALQRLGCTRIQGYLYSSSLSAEKCEAFIRKGAPVY
jgi:PTS system, lactose/cellobiose family IIC component